VSGLRDPRVEALARILVDYCLEVQPRWQVIVAAQVAARPLVEELSRHLGRRGAYVLPRIGFDGAAWASEAPEELLDHLPPLQLEVELGADARIMIGAPENVRARSGLTPERRTLLNRATRPVMEHSLSGAQPWVSCVYPTPALAQLAGTSLAAYEELVYGACLLDWPAERARLERLRARLEGAREVRIEGTGTDLALSVAERPCIVDDGRLNMPGGELYWGPHEGSATGVITFGEHPLADPTDATPIRGARLVLEGGAVVDATAEAGEAELHARLATDVGARRVGELGIGCNPGLTRVTNDVLFDEKVAGTVHVALGASIPATGGTNASALHWDLAKDLRRGGRLRIDGTVIQENGRWVF